MQLIKKHKTPFLYQHFPGVGYMGTDSISNPLKSNGLKYSPHFQTVRLQRSINLEFVNRLTWPVNNIKKY